MRGTSRRRGARLAIGFVLVYVIPTLVLCYIALVPTYIRMIRIEHIAIFLLTLFIACLGIVTVWSGSRSMKRLQRDMRSVAMGKWDGKKPARQEIDFLYDELNLIMDRIREQGAIIEETNRELERKVEEKTRQLIGAERLSAVGEKAAGIAHEMNNIMMPLIGYAAMLKARIDDEKLKRQAETIEECASRGNEIVRRLLTFARQDRSTFSPVDMDQVIRTIEKLMRPGLEEKGIQLVVDSQPVPPVRGNDSQLQQVLANLVINAQQSIMGPEGVIEIRSKVSEGEVAVAVKDNGEGMDEKMRREIFQPFFTTKGPGSGTGLGLSISYGIITEHGGQIDVQSSPGSGTTITIYLPTVGT